MRTIILVAVLAALAACNTVEGMGKDIKKTGEAIGNAASQTKDEM